MCKGCMASIQRLFLRFSSLLMALVGAAIAGYGIWLITKSSTEFTKGVVGLGGFILLTSLIGWSSVTNKRRGCQLFFAILVVVMILATAGITILLFVNREKLARLAEEHSNGHYSYDDFNRNFEVIQYGLLGVLGLQMVTVLCVLSYRRSLSDEALLGSVQDHPGDDWYQPTARQEGEMETRTDSHRKRLEKKYDRSFSSASASSKV